MYLNDTKMHFRYIFTNSIFSSIKQKGKKEKKGKGKKEKKGKERKEGKTKA